MINQFIRRILGAPRKKSSSLKKTQAFKIIPKKTHQIKLELISKNAIKVIENLQKAGYKAYIVGGAVRDLLLGIAPKDFDVATNATPEQVQVLFKRSRLIGKRFQIIHVTFYQSSGSREKPEIIEVTTFRATLEEGEHIAESGRILRDNVWGSQEEDAARRDFTINAMYYDPLSELVHDYHNGFQDILDRELRIIGDPAQRYREDPVRMLRAVRFAAKTGFSIEDKTLNPIHKLASLIHDVPKARLFDEMLKLLMSGHSWSSLEALKAVGLGDGFLPMLDAILHQEESQKMSFAKIALERTDQRVLAGKTISPGFLFASLLWHEVNQQWEEIHNTGKPYIVALQDAIDHVLANQREVFAIQRRFETDMREIWNLQPRFEKRVGRMPFRLLESPRFRAGFDFLALRCESGELPVSLSKWWEDFQSADDAGKDSLIEEAKKEPTSSTANSAGKSRRRRRRGPKNKAALEIQEADKQTL
ncbi:MAG: polynucleotide adenylyltransferase PcnB [Betaproteobacteria bacterium]|jgi:poly(A) polymerase